MISNWDGYRLGFDSARSELEKRIAEPAPGRIQLLAGPRQVGKTTLMLALVDAHPDRALYAALDGPEAATPGFWDRIWTRAGEIATAHGTAIVLLDEAHLFPDWSARLKAEWDRLKRRKLPVHVIATGSSALRLASGSTESLAGRFERMTLTHWPAAALSQAFGLTPGEAVDHYVSMGAYPGAVVLRNEPVRWAAYVRDAVLEPAIGRDIMALEAVRKPALLRQVFAACALAPAQVVSLQKIQGQLQDRGALATVAHYLELLEEAFLVAAIPKHATGARRRAAPPKIAVLNNALLAVTDPAGIPARSTDPARWGRWVENACIAYAWNAGQRVTYWREEPLEVDFITEGSWGAWAVEVKTGPVNPTDIRGIAEFCRRHPKYRPLVLCEDALRPAVERTGLGSMTWQDFLLEGPRTPG